MAYAALTIFMPKFSLSFLRVSSIIIMVSLKFKFWLTKSWIIFFC